MTANQIAAASVRENQRHNEAYEAETERHNLRQESIDEERNDIQESWNNQSLQLQDWYNTKYIEYLNADMEKKYELEKDLADIKRQQQDLDEWYKNEMARLQQMDILNQSNYRDEMAKISAFNSELQAKRDYYEAQKTESYITDLEEKRKLLQQELDDKRANIEHNYELGLISAEQRKNELALAQKEFDLKQREWNEAYKDQAQAQTQLLKQQKVQTGVKSATDIINAATDLVDAVTPF
jgi:hypothetical protein